MPDQPKFLFVCCQIGAERAVKSELARHWPSFRFAFSRPGFLTFKLPADHQAHPEFNLRSVFARSYGFSLGKVEGNEPTDLARTAWELCGRRPIRRIHAWQRDQAAPGNHDFSVSIGPVAIEMHRRLWEACPWRDELAEDADVWQAPAERGEFVLDCILVEPNQWWIGYHRAATRPSCWPGGILPLELPPNAVSRAWLKMEEALRWSQLPIPEEACVAEIGSAPGGASQALLDHGWSVKGIDPAEMNPTVLANSRFTHLRCRAAAVPRREWRKVRWLAIDMIVAPKCTLDVAESVVTHPTVNIRGMLLTLKLTDWKLAENVPSYLERIRSWGYNVVRARQLSHNRREFCVSALQKPFRRKPFPPSMRK